MQQCIIVVGDSGVGKSTALQRMGLPAKAVRVRQYDGLLSVVQREVAWLQRQQKLLAVEETIKPIRALCSLPSARRQFEFEGLDLQTGRFSAFGVVDKNLYLKTISWMVDPIEEALAESVHSVVVEIGVRHDQYAEAFRILEKVIQRVSHPRSPYFGGSYVLHVAAPRFMRERNLQKRVGNPVEDTHRHPGAMRAALEWLWEGEQPAAVMHRAFGLMSSLPVVTLLQHSSKDLFAYQAACDTVFETIS